MVLSDRLREGVFALRLSGSVLPVRGILLSLSICSTCWVSLGNHSLLADLAAAKQNCFITCPSIAVQRLGRQGVCLPMILGQVSWRAHGMSILDVVGL